MRLDGEEGLPTGTLTRLRERAASSQLPGEVDLLCMLGAELHEIDANIRPEWAKMALPARDEWSLAT